MIFVGLGFALVAYIPGVLFAWLGVEIEKCILETRVNQGDTCTRCCVKWPSITTYILTTAFPTTTMVFGSYAILQMAGWDSIELPEILGMLAYYVAVVFVQDRETLRFKCAGGTRHRYAVSPFHMIMILAFSCLWVSAFCLRNDLFGAVVVWAYTVGWIALFFALI